MFRRQFVIVSVSEVYILRFRTSEMTV